MEYQANLYTAGAKYRVEVQNDGRSLIYFDPEIERNPDGSTSVAALVRIRGYTPTAILSLKNHGWLFSDFWVTDALNNPPQWRHKLSFARWDGKEIDKAGFCG